MNAMDPSDEPREPFERTLGGLEQLAGDLDARTYPGRAWPVARARRPSQWAWKAAGSIAGIAALLAVALHFWKASPSRIAPAPSRPAQIVQKPSTVPAPSLASDESALPRIVIVEDIDSYSIIDLNNDMPLVSFASKDSPSLDDMTPILVDARPGL